MKFNRLIEAPASAAYTSYGYGLTFGFLTHQIGLSQGILHYFLHDGGSIESIADSISPLSLSSLSLIEKIDRKLMGQVIENGHNGSVLEIGCSFPINGFYLAKHWGGRVTYEGIDLSQDVIAMSLKLFGNAFREYNNHFHIQQADAHRLPYPDSSFDIVFADQCMHEMKLKHAASEMARVTKSGGYIIVNDLNRADFYPDDHPRLFCQEDVQTYLDNYPRWEDFLYESHSLERYLSIASRLAAYSVDKVIKTFSTYGATADQIHLTGGHWFLPSNAKSYQVDRFELVFIKQ
jgi:SAM-dependent methyltransferase